MAANDSQEEGARPRRRCASRHATARNMPSAVHYVGYVEDDETPEMIMRKFEELERIKVRTNAHVNIEEQLISTAAAAAARRGCSTKR